MKSRIQVGYISSGGSRRVTSCLAVSKVCLLPVSWSLSPSSKPAIETELTPLSVQASPFWLDLSLLSYKGFLMPWVTQLIISSSELKQSCQPQSTMEMTSHRLWALGHSHYFNSGRQDVVRWLWEEQTVMGFCWKREPELCHQTDRGCRAGERWESGWVFSKCRRLTEFGSKIDVHLIYSPPVLECEWAAEIRGGAGMKESSGWIQPDLKLHSTQQEKGRRVNVWHKGGPWNSRPD